MVNENRNLNFIKRSCEILVKLFTYLEQYDQLMLMI